MRGLRQKAQRRPRHDAERALAADEERDEVVAGDVLAVLAAEIEQAPPGSDDPQARDVAPRRRRTWRRAGRPRSRRCCRRSCRSRARRDPADRRGRPPRPLPAGSASRRPARRRRRGSRGRSRGCGSSRSGRARCRLRPPAPRPRGPSARPAASPESEARRAVASSAQTSSSERGRHHDVRRGPQVLGRVGGVHGEGLAVARRGSRPAGRGESASASRAGVRPENVARTVPAPRRSCIRIPGR